MNNATATYPVLHDVVRALVKNHFWTTSNSSTDTEKIVELKKNTLKAIQVRMGHRKFLIQCCVTLDAMKATCRSWINNV